MLHPLDQLLRGHYTAPDDLRAGRIHLPVAQVLPPALALGALSGLSMGLYAVTTRDGADGWLQALSASAKVPALFLGTLAVTFPSLYVVSALARSHLRTAATLRLLFGAMAVALTLLASLAPIVAFFTFSTESYPFMRLLNGVFLAIAGLVGLRFLSTAQTAALALDEVPPPRPAPPSETLAPDDAALPAAPESFARWTQRSERLAQERRAAFVFRAWVLVFGLVGAQMGWILRPLIGAPDEDFVLLAERRGSVFTGVIETLAQLFGA